MHTLTLLNLLPIHWDSQWWAVFFLHVNILVTDTDQITSDRWCLISLWCNAKWSCLSMSILIGPIKVQTWRELQLLSLISSIIVECHLSSYLILSDSVVYCRYLNKCELFWITPEIHDPARHYASSGLIFVSQDQQLSPPFAVCCRACLRLNL